MKRFFIIFVAMLMILTACAETAPTISDQPPSATTAAAQQEEPIIPSNEEEPAPAFEYGNITGHNLNPGYAVMSGDWIYYRTVKFMGYFEKSDCKLYKIRNDGTEQTLMDDDIENASFLNIFDDWIFFTNLISIYKIRTDGTEKTKIGQDYENGLNCLCVADGWVYYDIGEDDGWIYYQNIDDFYNLYKLRTDGTENIKISDETYSDSDGNDSIFYMDVAGDWIYYEITSRRSGPGPYCRIKTDGTNFEVLVP